jgi:hypothetical protein
MYSPPSAITEAATTKSIAYAQATPQQRVQALAYLRQRLRFHFPTLANRTWDDALALFQPDLQVANNQVLFSHQDLTELVQYLGDSPELPMLDPPLYAPPTLYLAQQYLHAAELAVWALTELEALEPGNSPRLFALVSCLARGNHVAEQVVQARRWGVAVGRPLPPSVPGGGPAPGSLEVERRLLHLQQANSSKSPA